MAFYSFNNIAVTGICSAIPQGKIAPAEQTASDLGFVAAKDLLEKKGIDKDEIGAVVFISKTPDYRSPATATVLHYRLKLSVNCIAYDINIGGAGFVYGLQIGCSLAGNINKPLVLLVIGDTTTKQVAPGDPYMNCLGDGAAAILMEKKEDAKPISIHILADGEGYSSYLVPGGGFRQTLQNDLLVVNEKEMHILAAKNIPETINEFWETLKSKKTDYDVFAISQENESLLKVIASEVGIPFEDIPVNYSRYGNTSGCSIPLVLSDTFSNATEKELRVLACAWGEGFSWGVADFFIDSRNIFPVIETSEIYDNGLVSRDF